ncbi:hypothetical protein BG000_004793 [Podila horticola]|nr:hypothetical protein BG000_004793 [Podila horticola]
MIEAMDNFDDKISSESDLPHIKGVTAFCEDGSQKGRVGEDGSIRLCVTKRRIIQFYNIWPDAISEAKELSLPNGALVVTRWKNYICVADANDFKLIDSRVGRMIPVLPVVQSASSGNSAQVIKPVCVAIAENEFLLASATSSGQTAIGIFCSGNGDPVRGTLQWSSYPRALGVEFPYVAALLKSGHVEIHNILDQKLIQTADGLLRNGHVEEALVLSEKTTATLSSDNLHSERLQQELDYIYQKSGLIYLGETLFDDAFALLQRGKIDPRAVIALFPDVLQKSNLLGDITVFVGVLELLKQLQSLPDIITRTMLKSGSDQGDEYKQMFLHNAREVFQQYLVTFRKQHANLKGSPSPTLAIFMPGDSKKAAMFDSATLLTDFKKTLSPNGIMAYLEYLVFQRKSDTGKQKAAIEVLVKDVRDYLGAEIFCLNAGTFQEAKKTIKMSSEAPVEASTLETRKSLFMMLLREYLHIPREHGGTVLSLRLLNSQSAYLELSEVIDLLPPYWTVELLQNYLLRSLRRSHHVFKEIQIMKGLSLGENLRISEELFRLYEEQGPVVVTPQDVCSVCGASIADSVFMPMGHVKLANYALAYKKIKNAAFDGPGSQSTVLFFVAADVDAICAFRILTTLFKSDCISYVVVPVAGMDDIQKEARQLSPAIRSVIMLNCGGLFNLEDYIELSEDVTIYVLDNHRPVDLKNAFWNNEVIVFHESDLDKELHQQKEAIIFTEENPDISNDSDASDSEDIDEGDDEDDDEDDEDNYRRRRRKTGIDTEVVPGALKRKWRDARDVVIEYMSRGITFGTSISNQCYLMASQLDRTSLNILWLAIVGLTAQYVNEQIGHKDYLDIVQAYKNESERMTPKGTDRPGTGGDDLIPQTTATEDGAIRCTDEYRFMMVRHWSLYESMYHSNYVASRLGIWREPGRKRLLALLAKMGFSLEECNQVFAHMSIDLKKILRDRIETVSPEYGLNEILYTSFTRSYGYRGLMSASDAVYAVTSLLETSPAASVALGYSVEWTSNGESDSDRLNDTSPQNIEIPQSWWHTSFFKACDALDSSNPEGDQLRQGVTLCMKIQKAIVKQAVAIIEKQVIITLSTCRVATLKDGPHLPIFWNPLTLNRLAQFLVYAIREYGSAKSGHRPIPLVLAVLKEDTQTFIVTGVHGSPTIGNVSPNKFGIVFEKIAYNEKIPVKHMGFDKATVEIDRDDLETFMKSIGRYMR